MDKRCGLLNTSASPAWRGGVTPFSWTVKYWGPLLFLDREIGREEIELG